MRTLSTNKTNFDDWKVTRVEFASENYSFTKDIKDEQRPIKIFYRTGNKILLLNLTSFHRLSITTITCLRVSECFKASELGMSNSQCVDWKFLSCRVKVLRLNKVTKSAIPRVQYTMGWAWQWIWITLNCTQLSTLQLHPVWPCKIMSKMMVVYWHLGNIFSSIFYPSHLLTDVILSHFSWLENTKEGI